MPTIQDYLEYSDGPHYSLFLSGLAGYSDPLQGIARVHWPESNVVYATGDYYLPRYVPVYAYHPLCNQRLNVIIHEWEMHEAWEESDTLQD